MKTVNNKQISIRNSPTTYFKLITEVVEATPQGGFTLPDMRARMKILDVLEKNIESFELEETEVTTLKQCVMAMQWGVLDRTIVEFADYIEEL